MMYGAEDDLIDVGKNNSGGVDRLLDDAETTWVMQVTVAVQVDYWIVQKTNQLMQVRMTMAGSVGGLLDGAEDDQVDIGDSSGVGGLLDGAEDNQVGVCENDNGGIGGLLVGAEDESQVLNEVDGGIHKI